MSNKWKHFSEDELKCPHCGECHMDDGFMRKLDKTRGEAGIPFIVTSGYRCPEYNDEISSTGRDGPHTTGKAVDIHVYGADAHKVLYYALRNGFSGIGVSQKGDYNSRFIHLDTLSPEDSETRPWIWSY